MDFCKKFHDPRKICLLPDHRVPSPKGIRPHRRIPPGKQVRQEHYLLQPDALYGLRPTDRTGQYARPYAQLGGPPSQILSSGVRDHRFEAQPWDRQRKKELQDLRGFAYVLIDEARKSCYRDDFEIALEGNVYALDSTTIDLCLSVFWWAEFRKAKGGIKLHTL